MADYTANTGRENVQFLSIEEFKMKVGKSTEKAQVVKNPNTGKLFLAIGDLRFKVQQDFDGDKEFSVLVPEVGGIDQACLVNVRNAANNVMFTL